MRTLAVAAGAVALAPPILIMPASASTDAIAFFQQPQTPVPPDAPTAPQRGVKASVGGATADILRLADQMGVPRGLALAVCRIESHCNYGRIGRQGERGPLQIKLQTARGLGYTGTAAGLNGYQGAYWGMRHLAAAYKRCGTARGAAKLHNAGLASSCSGSSYASRVVARM
jgi:soluble lytic murein transglycosylase-like protein